MGGVVHFEIPADDQERARSFYKEVFGWRVDPVPGMDDYNMVITTPMDEATGQPTEAGAINGGLFPREGELKSPMVTVDVEDIDAALEKIGSLGGSTVSPRQEVTGMGYAAYFRDPEGNVLGLWQNLPGRGPEAGPESGPESGSESGPEAGPEARANDIGA